MSDAVPMTPDLINIVSARLVCASEPAEGEKWQEGLIKQLTCGEPMGVRVLNEAFFEAHPEFRITISGRDDQDSGDREP